MGGRPSARRVVDRDGWGDCRACGRHLRGVSGADLVNAARAVALSSGVRASQVLLERRMRAYHASGHRSDVLTVANERAEAKLARSRRPVDVEAVLRRFAADDTLIDDEGAAVAHRAVST